MTADEFSLRLFEKCALARGSHVLLALSGGADSTALLCFFDRAAKTYPLMLSCAHVEHGIRGADSLEDLAFVKELCQEKGIELRSTQVDAPAYAKAHGCGLEDAARTLRYEFLRRTADEIGADVIALAHHAGDQAETVLLHAMRGSDVRGLCAMRWKSGRLIRPLLDQTPQSLRAYLTSIGQPWREDASNTDMAYARNRVRRDVLVSMEAAVPGTQGALCRLARAAQRDEDFFAQQLDALALHPFPLVDGVAIEKAEIAGLHPALLSRLLVQLMERAGIAPQSARVIEEIMDALLLQDAAVNLTGGAHASVGRRYLCLTRAQAPDVSVPLAVPGVTDTPLGRFEVRPAREGETGDGRRAQRVPRRLLEGARVTTRREGDTMVPFGKRSPVKLKKLMIDAGVERAMRRSVPVLRRDDTVLFAVGLRPAQCCRGAEDEEQMIVRFLGHDARTDEGQTNWEDKNHD